MASLIEIRSTVETPPLHLEIPANPSVWIDVVRLDAVWQGSTQYVGFGCRAVPSGSVMPDRYEGFRLWLMPDVHVHMPFVSLEDEGVVFNNGRHRFAWCRNHGVAALPVEVCEAEIAAFAKRFSNESRVSQAEIPG
jgi:hypothetical protein